MIFPDVKIEDFLTLYPHLKDEFRETNKSQEIESYLIYYTNRTAGIMFIKNDGKQIFISVSR